MVDSTLNKTDSVRNCTISCCFKPPTTRRAPTSVARLALRAMARVVKLMEAMRTMPPAIIAGGIVLIASINFTTLAIARRARRATEVGARRVVGGLKQQLIVQFLTESVLLSVLSTILGCLLAYTLLPWFNQLSGRELEFSFSRFPELVWMLCGLTLLVGLLAGSYPALVL